MKDFVGVTTSQIYIATCLNKVDYLWKIKHCKCRCSFADVVADVHLNGHRISITFLHLQCLVLNI